MELTEEIQRDPGRFLQNVDMNKIKTKEDLRKALIKQDVTDKRGRYWEDSVSRVVERYEVLYATDKVQDRVYNNIKEEVRTLPIDWLNKLKIDEELPQDKREALQEQIVERRALEPIRSDLENVSRDLFNQGKITKEISTIDEYNNLSGREKALISNEIRRLL